MRSEFLSPGDVPQGSALLAHGESIAPHRHREGQLLYSSAGVLTTMTERGTWMAPASRIAWTPPGFEHSNRAYGETELRILGVPIEMCAQLPAQPTVFGVTPLLREALLVLTSGRQLRPEQRGRLQQVVIDELTGLPEQALYLPEPADDRLRAVTGRLHANPADPSTLAELGHAVGASERTLSRLFQAELGMGFLQWRTQLRIQHALLLLLEDRPVTETAAALGWSEFPRERVGNGIAAVGSMIALGNIGVIFPGLIVPNLNWHWLFWIPLILTLLSLAGTWAFVRESPVRPGGSVNWVSAALMVAGFTAVVLAISEGDTWGWTSGKTLGLLGGGAVVCAAWVTAEARSENPLINMGLLRLRGVWTTNLVAFMIGAGMYSAFAVYPVFAELPTVTGFGYGASILRCGLYLLPLPVVSGLTGPFAARLANRFGAVPMLIASCVAWAAGFAFMAVWSAHPYDMMISIGLMGLGLGIAFNVLTTVVVHSVPARNVGETSGMNTVVRMLGGAIGTQVVVSLIASYQSHGLPAKTGFTLSYVVLAAVLVVAALAAVIISPRRAAPPGAAQRGAGRAVARGQQQAGLV